MASDTRQHASVTVAFAQQPQRQATLKLRRGAVHRGPSPLGSVAYCATVATVGFIAALPCFTG